MTMNSDQQIKNEKWIRSLYRELQDLIERQQNTPKVKLDEPFQRGFERFFVLTEEALRRSDAQEMEEALEYFQNYQHCRKGIFAERYWKSHRRKEKAPSEHFLVRPHLVRLLKKGISQTSLRYVSSTRYDLSDRFINRQALMKYDCRHRVRFRYPKLIHSQVQPHIVTHLPLHDRDLEARIEEIQKILFEGSHTALVHRSLHWRSWKNYEERLCERSSREDFKSQLEDFLNDHSSKARLTRAFFWLRCFYSAAMHARTMRISP